MTTEQQAVKRSGLTMIGKTVACVAVLLSGAFIVVKSNRTAAAAPVVEGGSLSPYECPVQATGNGVAIPDIDPRCL
jgi:hypothetical protein